MGEKIGKQAHWGLDLRGLYQKMGKSKFIVGGNLGIKKLSRIIGRAKGF
jgi:hypothetical protein